jgi:hypothetical protein
MMTCSNPTNTTTNTARVNPPVDNDMDTNQRHRTILQRLGELAAIARRMQSSGSVADTALGDTHTVSEPTTDTPQFQPPLISLPSPSISPAQRLTIAQAQWSKILSQRSIGPSTRQSSLSLANCRENTPWGDTLEEKGNNVTRIYSLNVNGLSIDRRGGRFDDLCKVGKEVAADVICCQEHNLDITRP